MGRPSKKVVAERKVAKRKHIVTQLVESVVGAAILSLIIYIVIGSPATKELIDMIQGDQLQYTLVLVVFLSALVVIFALNLVSDYLSSKSDKK